MENNNQNKKDYIEIPEEEVEILGKDGIYRKYDVYKKHYKKSRPYHWIPLILALIYTFSPLDLIPDKSPVGKIDDIIIIAITLYYGLKKADFSKNPIINTIIRNIILSTTITLFVIMILIYFLAFIL